MLWSVARYDFRLTDVDFLHLTIAQFCALCDRRHTVREEFDLRAALIASTVANCAGAKTEVDDFMPTRQKTRKKPQGQDWQTQLAFVEALNSAFGGTDMRQN